MKDNSLRQFLKTENEQIARLHDIVARTIEEKEMLTKRLEDEARSEKLSFADRLSDRVAAFGGSWRFIILFGVILLGWVLVNAVLPGSRAFDPYPFIFLNLLLSCIAALQAPVIMMAQNRQEIRDRARAENDYLVNLKSEIEIRRLHDKFDLLMAEQMKTLFEMQEKQLVALEKLQRKLG